MDGGGAAVAARVPGAAPGRGAAGRAGVGGRARVVWAVAVGALFAAAAPAVRAQEPTVVLIVRHAERAAEPGSDPGLSPAGEARALALAAALEDAHITGIVTTQYRRTRLTAEPLARALALEPLVVPAGGDVGDHARAVADTVRRRFAGRTVLVIGHSNTVSAIVAALGGPAIAPPCDNEFANLWVLLRRPSGEVSLVRSHYGAEDPPPPADCRR